MLCSNCKQREANFHYKRISDGKLSELHLCSECATFGFEDMLSDFFNVLKPEHIGGDVVCKTCGTTGQQFKKSGFVGCSDCYDTFASDVEKILSRIQPATTHKGKIAGETGEKMQKANMLKNLKVQLKQAILEERYEDAAKIRDEIKQYEKEDDSNA